MSGPEQLLFVYGTLRPAFDGPMAHWLNSVARHVGRATVQGALYRGDGYPAFVPEEPGEVTGDLFALTDAAAILSVLDEHEECADRFAQPHEYRRQRLTVHSDNGRVEAWAYIYNWDAGALARIESGDFLG